MNPIATNTKGNNSHSYPAYDYPVGVGTGLVAVKSGIIVDLPGVPTRAIMGNLNNTQHWGSYIANAQNSGNVITVSHGNGEYTCYLHASPFNPATITRQVKQGQVFAQSGHNGWSTGPHLHFEVWKNGTRIDPGAYLASIKKEENDMPDEGAVHNAYLKANGRKATPEEVAIYTKIPINNSDSLLNGKVFVDLVNFKKAAEATYKPVTEQLYAKT